MAAFNAKRWILTIFFFLIAGKQGTANSLGISKQPMIDQSVPFGKKNPLEGPDWIFFLKTSFSFFIYRLR